MTIEHLEKAFQLLLQPDKWASKDIAVNGLQVGQKAQDIRKIAFSVDACLESFIRAHELGAQALFVHHGLFWGKQLSITAQHYSRLEYLIKNDLALFAFHLPLDAHPELGNNAGLAKQIGLIETAPFGTYKGEKIGIRGILPKPESFSSWLDIFCGGDRNALLGVLPFGKSEIKSIGIVSGGAPFEVAQAIDEDLDVYITGDTQHAIYHQAKEAAIHVVCAGHYSTETWGVKLMSEWVRKNLNLDTVFLDVPTGL